LTGPGGNAIIIPVPGGSPEPPTRRDDRQGLRENALSQ